MLRVVAVADTHLYHTRFVVPAGDVFVHAGDLCGVGSLRELELAAAWITSLPHAHKIVVPGNHDWAFVRSAAQARALFEGRATVLEDAGVTIDGVRFWGSPWQPEFGGWAYNLPRGEPLANKWALIPDDTDVLITHGPPHGAGDRVSRGRREGCADLRARVAIVQPLVHFFGHIHEDGGLFMQDGVPQVNCTTSDCERAATVFDVDVELGRAVPIQVPPREK